MNRLERLLTIFAAPMQRLENAMIQLLKLRTVNTATGVQLDVLGKIVGQARGGLSDDDYRRCIRARIAANKSTGKREELIRVARLVLDDPAAKVFVRGEKAAVFVRIENVPESAMIENLLLIFLSAAVGTAIRMLVQTSTTVPSGMFRFAGGAVTGPGFDNSAAPGSGGQLADVRGSS